MSIPITSECTVQNQRYTQCKVQITRDLTKLEIKLEIFQNTRFEIVIQHENLESSETQDFQNTSLEIIIQRKP